jgi:hypothetical protein
MDAAEATRIEDKASRVIFNFGNERRPFITSPIYFALVQQIRKFVDPFCLNIMALGMLTPLKEYAPNGIAAPPLAVYPFVNGGDEPPVSNILMLLEAILAVTSRHSDVPNLPVPSRKEAINFGHDGPPALNGPCVTQNS